MGINSVASGICGGEGGSSSLPLLPELSVVESSVPELSVVELSVVESSVPELSVVDSSVLELSVVELDTEESTESPLPSEEELMTGLVFELFVLPLDEDDALGLDSSEHEAKVNAKHIKSDNTNSPIKIFLIKYLLCRYSHNKYILKVMKSQ